jgi:hypothetical protein
MVHTTTSPWLTARQLAIVAMFSALWAALEIGIGTVMVMLNMPFRGAILTALALGLLIVVRKKVPKRGTAITMGVIVAAIRLMAGGPRVLTIAPALVIESALVELAFLITSTSLAPNQFGCILGGMLAVTYSFFHNLLMISFISGIRRQHLSAVIDYLHRWRLGEVSLWVTALVLIAIHALLGAGAGVFFWRLTRKVGLSEAKREE